MDYVDPATTAFACFAPCPRGLEAEFVNELLALGASDVAATHGGVAFRGDLAVMMAVNLHTRLASRVLLQVARGRYRTDRDLHRLAVGLAWEHWFDARLTLRVDTRAVRSSLQSLNIATLRVKDGIVDRMREATGQRPDIDTVAPHVRVFCFLDDRYATLYLDTSGENLFKRGWRGRDDKGAAPLKENLAAGLLALAGWRPGVSLVDPFCGSGTIVIEAAQRCAGIAAGAHRQFGFEKLRLHDAARWEALRGAPSASVWAQACAKPATNDAGSAAVAEIHASDADAAMLPIAMANAKRAGLDPAAISFTTAAFETRRAPACEPGLLISNPPYGERMGFADAEPLATDRREPDLLAMGRHLREHWSGWTACFLSGDLKLPGRLGLKSSRRIPLFNGPIETRLFVFDIR